MTTNNPLGSDFASSMQQMNTAASATTTAPTPTLNAAGTDVDSIMRKMAEQQETISSLNVQLKSKSNDVEKLSEKQRQEMQHAYDAVIAQWIDMNDGVDQATRDEFHTGMKCIAKDGRQNPIFDVIMCASSTAANNRENAIKKETEFQALAKNYEELKTRVDGGRFANEDARVGSKRSAPDEQPLHPQGGPVNIWDQFGQYMKSSYQADTFTPTVPRPV